MSYDVVVGTDYDVIVSAEPNEDVQVALDFEVETIDVPDQGPPGPAGAPGTPGTDGNTVLYGAGPPSPAMGKDGDWYIDTTAHAMYGPKASRIWPTPPVSLIGPQGPQGNTILYGAGPPAAGTGRDGDFYIDTSTNFIYGPKASGAWPAGVSLVGPQGPQGTPGATGQRGSLFYTGSGAPGTITGQQNGDNYLNTANGDVYTLTSGAWTLVGNIRGPQGPAGPVNEAPTDGKLYARQNSAWVDHLTQTVRYDAAQSLTLAQRSQFRANIDITKKRYLLNGGMTVCDLNNYNTSGTGSGFEPANMFQYNVGMSAGGVATATNLNNVLAMSGSMNRLRIQVTTAQAALGAGDNAGFVTKIESNKMADLLWGNSTAKAVTLQFTVRTNAPGTYAVSIRNNASPTRSFVAPITITAAQSGQDVVVPVVVPGDITGFGASWASGNDFNANIVVYFCVACGTTYLTSGANAWQAGNFVGLTGMSNLFAASGNYFDITEVDLYEGNAAPPFQLPDYDAELVKCQRYWEKSYIRGIFPGAAIITGSEAILNAGLSGASVQIGKNIRFSVRKRSTPTMVLYSANSGAVGKMYDTIANADVAGTVDSVSDISARCYGTVITSGGTCGMYWHWTADARM